MSKPIVLKILTAGEGGVGKTTLLHRYIDGKFLAETSMTIGVEFFLKEFEVEGTKVALQLWDFGGQERFRFLLKSYAVGARGALLMFDLTRPMSLNNLGGWVDICRTHDSDMPIIFLGTKLDLVDAITVKDDFASCSKDQYNLFEYLKVSSKTGENVDLAFQLLTKEILKDIKVKLI